MDWKVSKEVAEVFEHPNADALEIVRLGSYQLVSGKGNYKTGDVVIIVPEKSVLSNGTMLKEYEKYLTGPKKDRVKSIQLRGEVSQGITWPLNKLEEAFGERISDLVNAHPESEDISELLGIVKYEPIIPANLAGVQAKIPYGVVVKKHDVLQYGAFSNEFDPEERVIITEKLHGTQLNYTLSRKYSDVEGGFEFIEVVASKGVVNNGLCLKEDVGNTYWQAVKNDALIEKAKYLLDHYEGDNEATVTIHGEVVPVQGGYNYGFTKPTVRVFNVVITNSNESYELQGSEVGTVVSWVPVLYDGPLKDVDVYELSKGKEQVSGRELHIKEGIVIQPYIPRCTSKGDKLKVKVINPKYASKENGEELS